MGHQLHISIHFIAWWASQGQSAGSEHLNQMEYTISFKVMLMGCVGYVVFFLHLFSVEGAATVLYTNTWHLDWNWDGPAEIGTVHKSDGPFA